MKIKIDENLPIAVAERFKDAGHDSDTVYSEGILRHFKMSCILNKPPYSSKQ
ncbi:MAG: DUF5615 family PIN-like protein [Bacillota bacterium]